MELRPPSYSAATSRNYLELVASSVRSEDLPSACLVSRQWHQAFAPQLWGNPMQNSEYRLTDPWLGLRKFERTLLHVARLDVRRLTHTLDVPVDTSSLTVDVGSNWLYNFVIYLPWLQSILVQGVPYFDPKTISAVARRLGAEGSVSAPLLYQPNLRLLDASNCKNMTEDILPSLSRLFLDLTYLDITGLPVRRIVPNTSSISVSLVESLRTLRNLKVLKLRNCRLNDDMVRLIVRTIKRRVQSLDLRDNPITNVGLTYLLEGSIVKAEDAATQNIGLSNSVTGSTDDPPNYVKQELTHQQNGKGLDSMLFDALTSCHVDHLVLEDNAEPGITQLQISIERGLSLRSLLLCLGCPNLRYLDIQSDLVLFDALGDQVPAQSNVEYLRIHHQLLTRVSAGSSSSEQIERFIGEELDFSKVLEMRRRIYALDQTDFVNLVPRLPKLQMLVLTGLPQYSPTQTTAKRLISLLQSCAVHTSLARSQAHFEYSRSTASKTFRSSAEQKRAKTLNPLDTIVLEVSSSKVQNHIAVSKGWNHPTNSKAVTEDRDSTSMWGLANEDFTFFRKEETDDELDARLDKPSSHSRNSRTNGNSDPSGSSYNTDLLGDRSMQNVIDAVVAFRQSSRQKYADELARGLTNNVIHEYWDAAVSLRRN